MATPVTVRLVAGEAGRGTPLTHRDDRFGAWGETQRAPALLRARVS